MIRLPEGPTRRLVGSIHRHPYLYLLGALAFSVAMALAGRSIKFRTGMQDLLPDTAPSVQAYDLLKQRIGSADVLVVTLMAPDFGPVRPVLGEIAKALEASPDVTRVVYKQDVSLLDKNALIIFPTLEELEEYYTELRAEIKKAVSKRLDLFDDDEGEAEPVDPLAPATFAWGEIEGDDGLSNLGRTFRKERGKYPEFFYNRQFTTIGLKVFPVKSSGDLVFAEKILNFTDATVAKVLQEKLGGVGEGKAVSRVVLGGAYRNALEQKNQIKEDMLGSVIFSVVLLCLVIIVAFRSVRALFCVIVPLLLGTLWSVGLVALTVGYVNLITAFIFAVLLGLGIDFGIHFYGRYREERAAGRDELEAMVQTHLHCGEASLLAAITTAASFLALTLADFRGFSQFGGVAAAGVMCCLLAVVLVLPALTFAWERFVPLKLLGYTVDREGDDIARKPFPVGKGVVIVAVLGALACFALGPQHIQFELDFRKLGAKHKKKVEHKEIVRGTVKSSAPAVIFADDVEEAELLYRQLEKMSADAEDPLNYIIKSYSAHFALVPQHQQEKIKWVHKICRKLKRKVKIFEGDQREGGEELLKHCEPEAFGTAELPEWVKAKFSDKHGKLGEFIYAAPRGSFSDGIVAQGFRAEVMKLKGRDGETPVISGKPLIWADIIDAMKRDGLKTTVAALIMVFLLLLVFERNLVAVLIVGLPLTIGIGVSVGVMLALGLKLNFYNMLALPTIVGMGVDDGVHMYHRYKELGRLSGRYIVKTTGMAAVITSITTSIGFGSLILANNYGISSLGLLTVVGISAALLTTLIVLPAALQWKDSRAEA